MNKNDVLTSEVIDYTHEGNGVVKVDGYPVFVPLAVVGETIEFKLIKQGKNFGIGKLLDIIQPSPDRVTPPCVYYEKCGGCNIQHLSYEAQLRMKTETVRNLVRKMLKEDIPVHETIGMAEPFRYRNKSQLPVQEQDGEKHIGFFRPRSHQIVSIDHCLIQKESHDIVMNFIKSLLIEHDISIYNEQTHKGLLRHVIIRSGTKVDEMMIVFVVTKKTDQFIQLQEALMERFPNIVSVKQNVNSEKTNTILGKKSFIIEGTQTIHDQLGHLTFEISDQSFYQVNHEQTEKLYDIALEYADLKGEENVIDAYCGIGTIGLYMADAARHVYGVEIVARAVEDARRNSNINQFKNTTFTAGKAEELMIAMKEEGIHPDVVMIDPPRKGCDELFTKTLLELEPEKIVYVSCNPSTLMRDIQLLSSKYQVDEITPVDMFPQTTHVEAVAKLTLKRSE